MRAGRSGLPVGTRVRLRNITDEYDKDLNGRVGSLARPFRKFTAIRDVGVILDPAQGESGTTPVTVYLHEFEVIQ